MQFELLFDGQYKSDVCVFSLVMYVPSLIQQSQQNKPVVQMPVYFQFTVAQARKRNCFRSDQCFLRQRLWFKVCEKPQRN